MHQEQERLTFNLIITRAFQIAISAIPCLTGFFAGLNNISGWRGTVQNVIYPLLSMQHTYPAYMHSWRAIHSYNFAVTAFFLMTSCEILVGILAFIGIVKMLMTLFSHPKNAAFIAGQVWARAACVWGILVWGIAFYSIGGDFFLSWQDNALSGFQQSGLYYAIFMTIAYFFLKLHEISKTI